MSKSVLERQSATKLSLPDTVHIGQNDGIGHNAGYVKF